MPNCVPRISFALPFPLHYPSVFTNVHSVFTNVHYVFTNVHSIFSNFSSIYSYLPSIYRNFPFYRSFPCIYLSFWQMEIVPVPVSHLFPTQSYWQYDVYNTAVNLDISEFFFITCNPIYSINVLTRVDVFISLIIQIFRIAYGIDLIYGFKKLKHFW